MDFQTKYESTKNVTIVEIPERLDLNNSGALRKLFNDLVKQGQFKWVMNLESTEYIDSSGLGAFVSQIATCRANNGDIHIAAPSEFVSSLLEVTHLNKVLKSFDQVQSAVAGFQEK